MSNVAVAYVDLGTASLSEVEEFIAPRLRGFVEVGFALTAVRERRLYLEAGFDRFEDYCKARWEMDDSRARQLCDAAQVHELTSTADTTVTAVENERQARELAPLLDDPEKLQSVWQEAVSKAGGKRVTSALIRDVIRSRRQAREQAQPPTPGPSPEPAAQSRPPAQPFPTAAHRIFMILTQAAEEVRTLGGPQTIKDANGALSADVRLMWSDRLSAVSLLVADVVLACGD